MAFRPDLDLLATLADGPRTWMLDHAAGEGPRHAFEAALEELQVLEVMGLVRLRTARQVAWRPTVGLAVSAELTPHGLRTLAGGAEAEERRVG